MVMIAKPGFLLVIALLAGLTLTGNVAAKKPGGQESDEWFMKTRLHVTDPFDGSEWQDGTSGVFCDIFQT